MSIYDIIIRNAQALVGDQLVRQDVALQGGKIAAILSPGTGEATEIIDARGLHLLPGAIDIHFHIRAPAFSERGTVKSETAAAAAGGVTTLFEMPITKPCCNTAERVSLRQRHFAEHALVNFGLYAAPGDLQPQSLAAMKAAGIIGFKVFTTPTVAGREDEFEGLAFPDEADQLRSLIGAAATGLPIVVHAESAQLLAAAEANARGGDLTDLETHLLARPDMCEAVAVAKLLTMNMQARAKLHIAHVTSALTVDVLRAFKGTSDFSAETCPHYLFRTADDVRKVGVFGKINPPVRRERDQQALWDALGDGTIQHVTTDHAAFSYEQKMAGALNVLDAPAGTPGAEVLVPAMLDAVSKGRLSLAHAMALLSGNAAERFSLPGKGQIAEGSDADLMLVDFAGTTHITGDTLLTFARDVSHLYYGARFEVRIARTLVGGRTVFDGVVRGKPGHGRYVRPLDTTRSAAAALTA